MAMDIEKMFKRHSKNSLTVDITTFKKMLRCLNIDWVKNKIEFNQQFYSYEQFYETVDKLTDVSTDTSDTLDKIHQQLIKQYGEKEAKFLIGHYTM